MPRDPMFPELGDIAGNSTGCVDGGLAAPGMRNNAELSCRGLLGHVPASHRCDPSRGPPAADHGRNRVRTWIH